jgi:hypothetical protein
MGWNLGARLNDATEQRLSGFLWGYLNPFQTTILGEMMSLEGGGICIRWIRAECYTLSKKNF